GFAEGVAPLRRLGHGGDQLLVALAEFLHEVLALAHQLREGGIAGREPRRQLGERRGSLRLQRALGGNEALVGERRVAGAYVEGRRDEAAERGGLLAALCRSAAFALPCEVNVDRGCPPRGFERLRPSVLLEILQRQRVQRRGEVLVARAIEAFGNGKR